MGFKVVISPTAREDLRNCFEFISKDNPDAAHTYCMELIQQAEDLASYPMMGRECPEFGNLCIRDIVYRNHRIVYRIDEDGEQIEISRFWHGARGDLNGLDEGHETTP